MKKMVTVVMALAFCFSLVYRAEAIEHSKRQSLDLKLVKGHYNAATVMGGVVMSQDRVSVAGMDLNWRFHKRFMGLSWGPLVSYRSISAPTGNLSFVGAGGSVGYVSNTFEDKNRLPIGWHTNFGVGIGKLSGMKSPYRQAPISAFGNWDFGLDCKVHGWDSSEPGKYKSALVASFDYGAESVALGLTTKTNPPKKGGMTAVGWVPKVGLSYYW